MRVVMQWVSVHQSVLLDTIVQDRHVISNRIQILTITGVLHNYVAMVHHGYSCHGHTQVSHLVGEVEEVGIGRNC